MSPQNSTGSTRDSDSWVSSHSCDSQMLPDDGKSRNTKHRESMDLLLSCPDYRGSLYAAWPQQTKKRKRSMKKLILDQGTEKRVVSPKPTNIQQEERELAGLEVQEPPCLKEETPEPPIPARDLQPKSPLEQCVKEDEQTHGEQGAEQPVGDIPGSEEQNTGMQEENSPGCCNTVESNREEESSRDSSPLSALHEEFGDSSDTKAEDDDAWDLITCFCLKPFAGRPMIECNECATWIHLSCAKIRKSNVPEVFICQQCRDAKQEIRRSNRARMVPRKRFCD
uniref:PHD finger protein 13 n=1 Tax=Sphenodon punctatus TaxID=8508 RepID=A0A8D0H9U4_SPHPU